MVIFGPCPLVKPPFLWGPLFDRTCWTCLNPPLAPRRTIAYELLRLYTGTIRYRRIRVCVESVSLLYRKWYEKLTSNGTIIVIRSGFFDTNAGVERQRQRHLPRHRCQDTLSYTVIQCSVKCLLTYLASIKRHSYSFVLDAGEPTVHSDWMHEHQLAHPAGGQCTQSWD